MLDPFGIVLVHIPGIHLAQQVFAHHAKNDGKLLNAFLVTKILLI